MLSVSPELIPYLEEYLEQQATTSTFDLGIIYVEALGELCQDGTTATSQLASEAFIMWNERHPRTAGKQWGRHIRWGELYPRIDYTARELSIGNLHFLRIDMGFELPLGVHLRTALGGPGKVEKNQCICAHLALGLEWPLQGRPRRVPNKSRVSTLASHLRRDEYQQAHDFTSTCNYPSPKMSDKLYSMAHDVMPPNRDRSFQDINLCLSGIVATLSKHVIRVFDLERQDNRSRINVHQFGDVDQKTRLDDSINLLVWRGHMGFLMPSTDNRPTSWRDWVQQVGEITVQDWAPWGDMMARGTDHSADLAIYPCKTCFRMCRFAPPELQPNELTSVGGLQPVKDSEVYRACVRRLYNLFDIDDLPLLEPPPGRENRDHTYSSAPTQTTDQPREPYAWDRMTLLERPLLPEQRLAPNQRAYQMEKEEQYLPDVVTTGSQDENVYGGSPSSEYNMHPAFEVIRLKRLRHSSLEDEAPNAK